MLSEPNRTKRASIGVFLAGVWAFDSGLPTLGMAVDYAYHRYIPASLVAIDVPAGMLGLGSMFCGINPASTVRDSEQKKRLPTPHEESLQRCS